MYLSKYQDALNILEKALIIDKNNKDILDLKKTITEKF